MNIETILADAMRKHGAPVGMGDDLPGDEYDCCAKELADLIRVELTGDEAVEAAAEAIHASDCGCPDWHADDQEDQTYTEHARAALAAVVTVLGGDHGE